MAVVIKGVSETIAHIERTPRDIVSSLLKTMTGIGLDLQGYVQRSKLQGQVLKHRTGWLSSHVHAETKEGSGTITTTVGVDTSAVPYAAIHEFGGTIHVPAVTGKLMVWQTKQGDTVFATAHGAYTVHMPERSYLRSALADKIETYKAAIRQAAYQRAS